MLFAGRSGCNQKRNPRHQLPVFINLLKLQISPNHIVCRRYSLFADDLISKRKNTRRSIGSIRTRPDLRQKSAFRPDFPAALTGTSERILIS